MSRYLVDEMLRREKQKLVAKAQPFLHGYIEYEDERYEYSFAGTSLEVYKNHKTILHSHIRNGDGKPMDKEGVEKTVRYLLEQTKEMIAKFEKEQGGEL